MKAIENITVRKSDHEDFAKVRELVFKGNFIMPNNMNGANYAQNDSYANFKFDASAWNLKDVSEPLTHILDQIVRNATFAPESFTGTYKVKTAITREKINEQWRDYRQSVIDTEEVKSYINMRNERSQKFGKEYAAAEPISDEELVRRKEREAQAKAAKGESDVVSLFNLEQAKSRKGITDEKRIDRLEKAAHIGLIHKEDDLPGRAVSLKNGVAGVSDGTLYEWPDFSYKDGLVVVNKKSQDNYYHLFDTLFAGGALPHPFLDTWGNRIVDFDGKILPKGKANTGLLLEVVRRAGLSAGNIDSIAKVYKLWAEDHQKNSIIDRVTSLTPQWDGVERAEQFFIKHCRAADTKINRMAGIYLARMIYNRMVNPGCSAPVILTLIGEQNCGKSYLQDVICKLITGNPHATSNKIKFLDITSKRLEFIRRITGTSVCATLGEMKGIDAADWDDVKDFVTATADDFDQKFEDNIAKPRQWFVLGDANDFPSINRDDTGNRRFLSIVLDPKEDTEEDSGNEKPYIRRKWTIDFKAVEAEFWDLMAEAAVWIEKNGQDTYAKWCGEFSNMVNDHEANNRRAGLGVIKNDSVFTWIKNLALAINYVDSPQGAFFPTEAAMTMLTSAKAPHINARMLKEKLEILGFESKLVKINKVAVRGYLISGEHDVAAARYCVWAGDKEAEPDFTNESYIQAVNAAKSLFKIDISDWKD
ncbi:hypothetical protein JX85_23610 [Salmonella enterica]|nr:hypothetical protein [Salmonella enterica]